MGAMTETLFSLDPDRPFHRQEHLGHNRWHPDIPPVASVRPGETFHVDCRDWFDGHVRNDDTAHDVLTAPFHIGHPLSGPFRVEGAKPGDLLVVDIVDVGPSSDAAEAAPGELAGQGWGYTVSSPPATAAVSCRSTSRTPTRRSGSFVTAKPPPGISRACRLPAPRIPG